MIEPDPIEVSLGAVVKLAKRPLEAQAFALEHAEQAATIDWRDLFCELRTLRPGDQPEDLDWWDDVILTTIAFALAPLIARLEALEKAQGAA